MPAALRYAARGWRVFPVKGKQPLTDHGLHDATLNEDQIREWWAEWPDANVALDLPAELCVIDVDPRNGGEVPAGLPPTRTVATPSGGWHFYFRVPEDVRLRGKLSLGVDVKRGGKGYVLAPPSVFNGRAYELVDKAEVAPLPAELLEELRKDTPSAAPGGFQFDGGTPYGLRALDSECGRLALCREGGRNDQLNASAFAVGQLIAGGELQEDAAVERLVAAAELAGLDEDEISGTLFHALDDGKLEPRSAQREEAATPAFRFGDDGDDFWLDWEATDDPIEWLFDPILPAHAFVLVFGPTQASKSMVARWLAAELSHEGRRVSYYSLENPSSVDRRDLKRLKPSRDRELFRITNQMLNLADPEQVEALVEREQGRDLIVLDTYVHAFWPPGSSGDENANAVAFARVVRYVMKRTGAAVLVVDHSGFEVRDDPRGASAKRQQVDVAIAMTAEQWEGRGHDARFVMRNVKAARFGNPFTATGVIHDEEDGSLSVRLDLGSASHAMSRAKERRRASDA